MPCLPSAKPLVQMSPRCHMLLAKTHGLGLSF
uniref:Uncharacterized protein n=1 Tax=Rhizophora mucronata TaxID=61149 RepID=A0A2P2P5S9_RHIMU